MSDETTVGMPGVGPQDPCACLRLPRDTGNHTPEYLEELVDLRVTREKGPLVHHLNKDAPDRPDVDGGRVVLRPCKHRADRHRQTQMKRAGLPPRDPRSAQTLPATKVARRRSAAGGPHCPHTGPRNAAGGPRDEKGARAAHPAGFLALYTRGSLPARRQGRMPGRDVSRQPSQAR